MTVAQEPAERQKAAQTVLEQREFVWTSRMSEA